jgi:hypothetical protein
VKQNVTWNSGLVCWQVTIGIFVTINDQFAYLVLMGVMAGKYKPKQNHSRMSDFNVISSRISINNFNLKPYPTIHSLKNISTLNYLSAVSNPIKHIAF